MWRIEVPGRMPSLNQWLSGTHWRRKNSDKKFWQEQILWAFRAERLPNALKPPLRVDVLQMTKMPRDVDNAVLGLKFCLDALVAGGYLPDDSAKYVPSVGLNWKKAEKQEKTIYTITELQELK